MIPILFKEDEINFNSNGIGHLTETVTYEVREVRNGEFELYLEYPVSGRWFNEIKDFRFILAEPNEVDDDHLFRIYETVKDAENQSILVYATTKSNDLGGNLVNNVIIDNETAQQAMNRMKAAMIMASDYDFVSDIQTRSSTQWIRRNPLNCIAGEEGSLVNYWGGEIKRTNTTIHLYSRRGKDRVTTIRPGKSLDGFKITSSTKGMITRILPFFTYTPEGSEDPVTITGSIVDSPLVNNYPVKYITPVDFSSDRDIATLEQLNSAAKTYFSTMNPDCDKPSVELDVDLIQLSDSSEYEKFKALERIQLTDTVIVWVKKYNVDVEVKVTEITYNGMLQQVTNIVAGTKSTDLYSDVKKSYQQDISELQKYVNGMENGIRNVIQISADGKNRIFRGYTEPDISISVLNDVWYKELGSGEVEMLIFDGAYWQPLITAGLNEAVKAEVNKMIQQADTDRAANEQAYNNAITLGNLYTDQKAGEVTDKLDVVKSDLASQVIKIDATIVKADKAISDANFAKIDANTAIADSASALTKANKAITDSGTAVTNAASALTRVGAVELTTGSLTTSYNTLTQTVGLKADKTTVDGINSTVTTQGTAITANATAIGLKADKNVVDTLSGTVSTHTTQIKATADGLSLKADATTVNTLSGTVNTHTTQISANSTAIGLRLTSAQVESAITAKNYVNTTTLDATASGLSAQITQVSTDLGTTDTKIVAIEANIDGINTTVLSKADKTQITQLSNQISSKVESATYSTKMTQLDTAINLRVVQGDVTAAILADKTIKDTRNDNQLPSWYYTNYVRQTAEEFKLRTAMGVPGSSVYGQLTTKVPWADYSGGAITQIFSSSDGVYQRRSTSATTWSVWDKIAETGKLIAQINLSTEGILLQGKHIQLDGDVSMNAAFISRLNVLTLSAVYGDIATLKTKVLTADVITSTMIKSDTALITKLFATDANVQILTAKTAFINAIQAVTISATKITSGILNANLVDVINLKANNVTSGTFNGLTFVNPYSITGMTGTTTLQGDLTSQYTKSNGQYGTMAFSRDRIFSTLYNSAGALVTGYNLSSEALNFNSSFGTATYNFDNIGVTRNDGASTSITFAYAGYGMQIHSDYGLKLGWYYFGKKETLVEIGTGNSPDVRFGADISLLTHNMYSVGKINFNAQSYITAPTADGVDIGARTFTKFTLSGWDAMYLSRDGSTGINKMDMYGNLNMNGDINLQSHAIYNSGRIRFNDQSYVDAPNADSSRINARTYTAFTLSGWDAMYLVRDQNTGNNRMDMYGNINMNSFQVITNSDRRLKTNIKNTKVVALDLYRKLNIVDYEWIDPNQPKGVHMGVIAQDTPFWSEYDAATDIWKLNNTKQVMYNSLGIKELTSIVDYLECRIEQLETKIKQMESAA